MRLPNLPHKYARLAQRVEEVAALLNVDSLPLLVLVLVETGGDVEAAKARALAAHLAARPRDAGREIEWMVVQFVEAVPQP
jgi:hypothetical protein